MKKFRFSLQSVLNVKLSLEKQCKADLAAADERIRLLNVELQEIGERYERTRGRFNADLQEGTGVIDLVIYSNGFRVLREKTILQKRRILAAEEERRRVQNRLLEAMKERKILENLKEKHRQIYLEESRREEARNTDDYMSYKVTTS